MGALVIQRVDRIALGEQDDRVTASLDYRGPHCLHLQNPSRPNPGVLEFRGVRETSKRWMRALGWLLDCCFVKTRPNQGQVPPSLLL